MPFFKFNDKNLINLDLCEIIIMDRGYVDSNVELKIVNKYHLKLLKDWISTFSTRNHQMLKSTAYIALGLAVSVVLGVCVSKIIANFFPYQYLGYLGVIKTYSSSFATILMFGINFSYFFHYKAEVTQQGLLPREFNRKNLNFILLNSIVGVFVILFYLFFPKVLFLASWYSLLWFSPCCHLSLISLNRTTRCAMFLKDMWFICRYWISCSYVLLRWAWCWRATYWIPSVTLAWSHCSFLFSSWDIGLVLCFKKTSTIVYQL